MARHQIAPAWQTSRGPLVRASGCAAGVPVAGARVLGQTRQNLWVNPSGTQGGITLTSNQDGSMSISGTSTEAVAINIENVMILKPGTTYMFSVDQQPPSGVRFRIGVNYNEGTYVESDASVDGATFTTPSVVYRTVFQLSVDSGATVSGTYRVMLNEGGEPQPWCPPGLTSVSELGVACAGKNLLKINSDLQTKTINGVTFTPNEDGTVTVNGTATSDSDYYLLGTSWAVRADNYLPVQEMVFSSNGAAKLYGFDSSGSVSLEVALNGGNQIISAEQIIKAEKIVCYLSYASGQGETNKKVYAQLELGSSATAYEPPNVTTATIDLAGHQLRSLPDGTRDVLTVDGSGAVAVDVRTHSEVWDGVTKKVTNFDGSYGYGKMDYSSVAEGFGYTKCLLVDTLPITSVGHGNAAQISSDFSKFCIEVEGCDSSQALNDWLQDHPTTIVYTLATPQTLALDPITPPSIPAADATLWAASDVPCELEATTWTASGAEQGRQQAAMVKVAQQVRQQAETVAALTTQALEA